MIFKKLLDQYFQNILLIIEFAYDSENNNVFYQDVSEIYGISAISLFQMFKKMEKTFYEPQQDLYFSYSFKKEKIVFYFEENYLYQNVYQIFLQKSLTVNFLKAFLTKGSVPYRFTKEQIPDLGTRLSQINQVLQEYQLSMNVQNRSLKINGTPIQKRYFLFNFFWHYDVGHDQSNSTKQKEKSLFSKIQRHNPSFSCHDFHLLKSIMIVSHIFIKKNEPFSKIPREFYEIENDYFPYTTFKSVLMRNYSKIYSALSKKQLEAELRFAYGFFSSLCLYSLEEIPKINIRKINLRTPFYRDIEKLIHHFCEYFHVELSQEEYLYLYINLRNIQTRLFNFTGFFTAYDHRIEQVSFLEYPQIYSNILTFFKELFYTRYSQLRRIPQSYMFLFQSIILQHQKKILIQIKCQHGYVYKEMIEQRLQRVAIFPVQLVFEESVKSDLIISDNMNFEKNEKIPVFYWQKYPSKSDWQRLEKRIAIISYEKNKLYINPVKGSIHEK